MKEKEILVFQRKDPLFIDSGQGDIRIEDFPVKILIAGDNNVYFELGMQGREPQLSCCGDKIVCSADGTWRTVEYGDEILVDDIGIVLYPDKVKVKTIRKVETDGLVPLDPKENRFENFPKYQRSPRLIKRVPTERIHIENPPSKAELSKTSLAQIIITPLIMLCITVAVSILMKRGIYVVVSVATTIVSMVASVIKYIHDKRDVRQQNQKREEIYDEYLLKIRKDIYAAHQAEQEAYTYNYPSIRQIENMINECSSRIYERSAGDEDFLTFAIGHQAEPVSFAIDYTYKELAMEDDALELEAQEICNRLGTIENKPVVIDLKQAHVGLQILFFSFSLFRFINIG